MDDWDEVTGFGTSKFDFDANQTQKLSNASMLIIRRVHAFELGQTQTITGVINRRPAGAVPLFEHKKLNNT